MNTTASNLSISSIQRNGVTERPRPKGNDADAFVRSASLRLGELNQAATLGAFKRQSSLRPSDLPSIQEARQKDLTTHTSKSVSFLLTNVFNRCFFLLF